MAENIRRTAVRRASTIPQWGITTLFGVTALLAIAVKFAVATGPFGALFACFFLLLGLTLLFWRHTLVLFLIFVGFITTFDAFLWPLVMPVSSLGVLLYGPRVLWHQRRADILVFCLGTAWLVGLPFMDWTPRKPYLRAFHRISATMTIDDALDVFRQEFRGEIPPHGFTEDGVIFTLDPDDGRFNSENIVLYVSNGRVVSKEYWRD